jgi:transposase
MQTNLSISPDQRTRLEAIVSHPATCQKHVWRCRIVLLSADGLGVMAIVSATGKTKKCVWRWRERFKEEGVDGLLREKTRPPGTPKTPDDKIAKVIRLTQEPPDSETAHWTLRAMVWGDTSF